MKNLSLYTLIIFLGLSQSYCGFKQDPLADKPTSIQDAKPPAGKVDPIPVVPSDLVRIDSVDFFSFKEERSDSFDIAVRVLDSDYETEILIDHLEDLPGATFDAVKGVFSWQPQKGTVTTSLYKDYEVKVRAFARKKGDAEAAILTKEKIIRFQVGKVFSAPEIVKIDGLPRFIIEEKKYTFSITVKDVDAGALPASFPYLSLTPSDSTMDADTISLVPFIRVENVRPDLLKNTFVFNLSLNLEGVELTSGIVNASAFLRVSSQYNNWSDPAQITTKLLTKLGSPNAAQLVKKLRISSGVKTSYTFWVYDPRKEADLDIDGSPRITFGSELDCNPKETGIMVCVFTWTPTAAQAGETYSMDFSVRAFKRDAPDVEIVTSDFSFDVEVTKPSGAGDKP